MAKNMFYNIKIAVFLWPHRENSLPLHPISDGMKDWKSCASFSEPTFRKVM